MFMFKQACGYLDDVEMAATCYIEKGGNFNCKRTHFFFI